MLQKLLHFIKTDIGNILDGTERQGYELTFQMGTTNKWDNQLVETPVDYIFEDAVVSGIDQASYDAGEDYSKYNTISGIINNKNYIFYT